TTSEARRDSDRCSRLREWDPRCRRKNGKRSNGIIDGGSSGLSAEDGVGRMLAHSGAPHPTAAASSGCRGQRPPWPRRRDLRAGGGGKVSGALIIFYGGPSFGEWWSELGRVGPSKTAGGPGRGGSKRDTGVAGTFPAREGSRGRQGAAPASPALEQPLQ